MRNGASDTYDISVTTKTDRASWQTNIRDHLALMREAYDGNKRVCCGIDTRLSAAFVKQELMACDALIRVGASGVTVGFAFVNTKKFSCMHASLMSAFRKGVGRVIIHFLRDTYESDSKYLTLRSTDLALGFYLRMGFLVFNEASIDEYISGGDAAFTEVLRARLGDDGVAGVTRLHHLKQTLRLRLWMDPEQEEWPLLLRRPPRPTTCRRSTRLALN